VTIALTLSVFAVAAFVGALLVARRSPGYAIGRTLAAAPQASIEEGIALAAGGSPRYVRLHGRISSDEEFPDENNRPLVYRRKRVELRQPDGRWRQAAADQEGVPFGIESRSSFIAVDSARLERGLVVLPRQADGVAADLPADLAATASPATPARLVIEQISAVEHAYVAGVPQTGDDGQPTLSSGLGRPLILTTLELPEAMRLLGAGQRAGAFLAVGLIAVGGLSLVGAAVALILGLG
jgi:hypothetical protein